MQDVSLLSPLIARAVNIAVLSFCSMILIVILLGFPRVRLKYKASKIFYAKLIVTTCMIICYDLSFIHGPEKIDIFNVVTRSLAYVGIYAVYVLYIAYIKEQINNVEKLNKIPDWVSYVSVAVGAVGALLWVLSLFNPAFTLNEPGSSFDSVYLTGHGGGFVLIIISLVILSKYRSTLGLGQTNVLMTMPILMTVATLCEPVAGGIELRYPAVVLQFLIVYTQHHMELEVRQEREAAEGLQNRLSISAGRMKSHFIYNVLTTIYYLCDSDPAEAQRAVGIFSDYMKTTLDAIEKQELVSFRWELNEIKSYLALEKTRFGDKLEVVYDIEYEDFELPPLSVQPVVENAIRHGIGSRPEGGRITVISRKLSDGGAQIRVRDNGNGFDVSSIAGRNAEDSDIPQLRERLKREVGGELSITSVPGKGSMAIITIRARS